MPIRFKKYLSALYKNTWLLFACTAGTVGVAFAVATPPMLGLDEAAHFNRVYQISEGGVRSTISPSGRDLGGPVPAAVVRLQEESIIIRKRQSNKTWPDYTRAAYNTSMKGEKTVASFPGAATYSPFAYGTGTLGMLLARVLNLSFGATVLLVRLTMLAGCVAAVAYAIFLLRNYKIKWLVFVLALWPQSIFQASVITADSAATALCFLLFAFYFKAFSQGSKKPLSHKNMLLMALCAVILPLVKVNYLPVSLVAAFVPLPIIARKVRGVQMPAYVYRLVFGGFVVMLAVAWLYVTKDYTNLIYPDRGVLQAGLEPGTKGQLLYVLGNPLRLVRVLASTVVHSGLSESWDHVYRMVGRLGYNGVRVPAIGLVLAWSLALVAVAYARKELLQIKKYTLLTGLLGLLMIAGIFVVLYLTFTPVGGSQVEGVQGRYFIPVIPFILCALGVLLPVRVQIVGRSSLVAVFVGLSGLNALLALFYYVAVTYAYL